MAKKSSKKLNLVNVVGALIAMVAVVLFIFLPMVKGTMGEEGNQVVALYSGFGMVFGGTVNVNVTTTVTGILTGNVTTTTGVETIENVALNTMAMLSTLLVVLGAIFTLLVTFAKKLKGNKLFTLVAGALLVVGGVLMFTVKGSSLTALEATNAAKYFSLAIGPILAGILSILAGVLVAVYPALKK